MKACAAVVVFAGVVPACSYADVLPGHRALYLDEDARAAPMILAPGRHKLGTLCFLHACRAIADFDVTYTIRHEPDISAVSRDGVAIELGLDVVHRPIVLELSELRTAMAGASYDAYAGSLLDPAVAVAAIGVIARHPASDLASTKVEIEDEIERDVRARLGDAHLELSTITIR